MTTFNIKPLNLDSNEREGCTICFNLNKWALYLANGAMMHSCYNRAEMEYVIQQNNIVNPIIHSVTKWQMDK